MKSYIEYLPMMEIEKVIYPKVSRENTLFGLERSKIDFYPPS